jgi:hypothetical protein
MKAFIQVLNQKAKDYFTKRIFWGGIASEYLNSLCTYIYGANNR